MGRSPCCEREGLNRGAWTALEDKILTDYIKAHGEGRWRNVPKNAGLKRCGKSCRLRWLNYLRPDIKRGNITRDEEDLIIRLHKLLGNRWSLIAGRLPGRTDNEIKNYWNTNVGKKIQPTTTPSPPDPPMPPISMQRPTTPQPTYPKSGIDYRASINHPKLVAARPVRSEALSGGGRSALIMKQPQPQQQQQQRQGSPQEATMKAPAVLEEHSPRAVECEKTAVAAAVGHEFPTPSFEDSFVPPCDDDLWMINCFDHRTVDGHVLSSDYCYFLDDTDFGHHRQPCGFEYRDPKSGAATPNPAMHGDEEWGPQSPNLELVDPFLEAELDCWLS